MYQLPPNRTVTVLVEQSHFKLHCPQLDLESRRDTTLVCKKFQPITPKLYLFICLSKVGLLCSNFSLKSDYAKGFISNYSNLCKVSLFSTFFLKSGYLYIQIINQPKTAFAQALGLKNFVEYHLVFWYDFRDT